MENKRLQAETAADQESPIPAQAMGGGSGEISPCKLKIQVDASSIFPNNEAENSRMVWAGKDPEGQLVPWAGTPSTGRAGVMDGSGKFSKLGHFCQRVSGCFCRREGN